MNKIEVYMTDSDANGMHQIVVRRLTTYPDSYVVTTVLRSGECNWPEAIVKTLHDAGMVNAELYSITEYDFDNCYYDNAVLIPVSDW